MILYLDTSALVKKYFLEPGTDDVISIWNSASWILISIVGFAESMAAFHRKKRETSMEDDAFEEVLRYFRNDYESMVRIQVNDEFIDIVSSILSKHPLRGSDAIHLASALIVQQRLTEPILFSCFDRRLLLAAQTEGLRVFPESF